MCKKSGWGNILKYYVNFVHIYSVLTYFQDLNKGSGPLIPILSYIAIKLWDF